MPYVPLHVHSVYSSYESLLTIDELVSRASFLGFPAVALTDHWSTFGHFEFEEAARKSGIKPIFGAEIRHESLTGAKGSYHLTLFAENEEGYRNLCSLVSRHSFREREGHVTAEEIASFSRGIIVLTGCLEGEAAQAILHGNLGRARDAILRLLEIFGKGNVFVELMNHKTEDESLVSDQLLVIAEKIGIPVVATNNARFAQKEDAEHFEVANLIWKKHSEGEKKRDYSEYYLKRGKELELFFSRLPADAIERSGEIAERCNVELPRRGLVVFSELSNPFETLSDKCRRRFKLSYNLRPKDERASLLGRMERELRSAAAEDVCGFLLFMQKLFLEAESRGIWLEVGGGTLLESLLAHLLELVPIDPTEHGLLFESFNPSRQGPPFVELITSEAKKEELFSLVKSLLPGCPVYYQMTKQEMSLAAIARELGDLQGINPELTNELVRHLRFSERRARTLVLLLESSPEIQRLYAKEELARKILSKTFALQGKIFHTTLDSSRFIVLPPELDGFISIVYGPGKDEFAQIGTNAAETRGGWLAIIQHSHFLSAVAETVEELRSTSPAQLRVSGLGTARRWMHVRLDDPKVYALASEAETEGVYLLESEGIRNYLRQTRPSCFEELVNVISLYRPGPMEGRLYEKYIDNVEKKGKVMLPHPSIAATLASTRGVLLYREQVREIIEETCGARGTDAATIERALVGKDSSEILSARLSFVRGAMDSGKNEEDALKIFDYLSHSISYTHSKALSVAQASLSYRTAYLKAYAFEPYFASLLNSNLDVKERIKRYAEYVRSKGTQVRPAGINDDAIRFLFSKGEIRGPIYALVEIQKNEWEAIVEERALRGEFLSIENFLQRMGDKLSEKSALIMVDAGVFDELGASRERLRFLCASFYEEKREASEAALRETRSVEKKRPLPEQISLFEDE